MQQNTAKWKAVFLQCGFRQAC